MPLPVSWLPAESRDDYLAALWERGVGVAVNHRAVNLLTYFRERFRTGRGLCPVAESIGNRTISLPLYPGLSDAEQDRVIESVLEVHQA